MTEFKPKTRKRPNPIAKCIFSEPSHSHKPLDREHVWGKWLRPFVRTNLNKHHLQSRTIGRPGTLDVTERTLRAGDPLLSHVRVVCKRCNSGWLSEIQNAAKQPLIPLIEGRRTVLSGSAQDIIAVWCAMATVTAEYLTRDETAVAISQVERDWLRDHRTPPENWKIWIGYYPGRKGIWDHYVVPILGAEDAPQITSDGFAQPNTQTTTFVVGNLLVHALSSTGDTDLVSRWNWPAASRVGLNLPQIFPRKESFIAWPPNGLTDFDVKLVSGALGKVIDDASRGILGNRIV
jgi:hypothetical protein